MKNVLVISPHLDDAALSCALTIRNCEATVLTVFSFDEEICSQHKEWSLLTCLTNSKQRIETRKREDVEVWKILKKEYLHLDYLPNENSGISISDIASSLTPYINGYSKILVPAGIGFHPEHIAVRDAMLSLDSDFRKIRFYGELPYTAFYGWPNKHYKNLNVYSYWDHAINSVNQVFLNKKYHIMALSDKEVDWKIGILSQYKSQYSALHGGSLELFKNTDMLKNELEIELSCK